MVRFEGKKSILLFCIFIFLPSVLLFLLSGSRNLSEYITTSFYVMVSIACFVILGAWVKSDDKYYRNFTLPYLLTSIVVGLGMIGLSWGLSMQLKNPDMLLSVNSGFLPGLSTATGMSLTAMPTSITTLFLSTLLYGLVMAATSEELFKLTLFAEGKERWGKGYKLGKITIPGVLVYVGFPVGFWAALHGISAYQNPVMILPAFVNGIVLIILLWKSQSILCVIFSHFVFNSGILTLTYLNGSANIATGTPMFPNILDRQYFSNSGFIFDFLIFALLCGAILFFILPSLTNRDHGQRKR
jgi:membrane protease YdiL (CAAX protease family)